jgi:hypothetical protein
MPKVNFPHSMHDLPEPEFSEVFNRTIIDQQCHDCQWFIPERRLCGFNVDSESGDTLDLLYEHDEGQVVPLEDCVAWVHTDHVVPKVDNE